MHPVFADPKTDFVFKRIFGDEKHKPLLIALLNDLLELKGPRRIADVEHLPAEQRVAVPEMSCGLVISRNLEGPEEGTVEDIVTKCFGDGSRPLAQGIFEPEELVPDWAAA